MDGNGQSDMLMENPGDESHIEHNGKKYSRIQIDGLGEDQEYLMDENGDIYSTDFVFITNMGDNIIVDEDEDDEEEA